jgi:predicted nucleic acid-binding protein
MPTANFEEINIKFSRNVLISDTNVIYAYFSTTDERHEDVTEYLDNMWDGDILIPSAVIIETWGLLVGRDKNWTQGVNFLNWLNQPNNYVILPHLPNYFANAYKLSQQKIDCVDSCLVTLAIELSKKCNFAQYIPIATYDTSDLLRCKIKFGDIRIFDFRTLDYID